MMSDNTMRFRYMSHDFMSNISKRFGDFDLNLLLGATIDETKTDRVSMMAYNFTVPDFFSYANAKDTEKRFFTEPPRKGLSACLESFALLGTICCI